MGFKTGADDGPKKGPDSGDYGESISGSFYFNTMKHFPKNPDKPKPIEPGQEQFGRFAPPQYDLSPEEIDKIRRRRDIRRNLKEQFNRIYYEPYRYLNRVELHDPRVERFMAMRTGASFYDYWKPTWKSFFLYYGTVLIPTLIMGYLYNRYKKDYHEKVNAGLITPEMRKYKTDAGMSLYGGHIQ